MSYERLGTEAHNCHGKTKNLTAKTNYRYLIAKPNTSQEKQNSFGFVVGICFCHEVFGFCCEVFGSAVRSLVLPWGFWFCHEVLCFRHEVFGFTVRFLVLPWQLWATIARPLHNTDTSQLWTVLLEPFIIVIFLNKSQSSLVLPSLLKAFTNFLTYLLTYSGKPGCKESQFCSLPFKQAVASMY